ncbi:alpha-glucan family phosphorylase [bacterium]|nr:alpha-glucan family phosphorylase [bacterium]
MIDRKIAYFSMEIGLENAIPTYSGGLGVLAGDTIRSAADLKIPMVAVTLLHRKGYFNQKLDSAGRQTEEPVNWSVEEYLHRESAQATVTIEGRTVKLQVWRYDVTSSGGHIVPVYLLDSSAAENSEWDRCLTDSLYGGERRYRLCQEVILGIGGLRILRELGYSDIKRYHLNEGHAALLTLELLREVKEKAKHKKTTDADLEKVREQCVFTTHTPVPAGHDQFDVELAHSVLDEDVCNNGERFCLDGVLNMTYLALELSDQVNGVAKKHSEISRFMFADYTIDSITNGVHAATWTSEPFQRLYDKYIPGWKEDNFSLRSAFSIPNRGIWLAHEDAKCKLIDFVNETTDADLDPDSLTIGFARRSTPYKRAQLVFHNPDRLIKIAAKHGPIQFVFACKAHPADGAGKQIIQEIFKAKESLKGKIRIAYLPNYDMDLGLLLTSGVDVWLNNPIPPREASGTSGMKATLNGVPSLSILDGWWIEGCIEGLTGWSFGEAARDMNTPNHVDADAESLYKKLEKDVVPVFYRRRDDFIRIMQHAIALNGSFFNTQRMMLQYVMKAYF